VVFRIRLPRALTAAFIDQALRASEGMTGLSAAMRGLTAARTAIVTEIAAIDADMRRMTRASAACRRLLTIPGVGPRSPSSRQSMIRRASAFRETSVPIWGWFPGGISPARSTLAASGSRSA
jgi:transposase